MSDSDAIVVSALSVRRGDTTILNEIDLSVAHGRRVLVFGRNGAGKTTLLKVILGLIRPSSGQVRVLGMDVGGRHWYRERHRIGYLHQESINVDFPISAYEVAEIGVASVRRGRRQRRERVHAAMKLTGCYSLRSRPYSTLSGGEKQKVSLARCVCQAPRILVLDEPTSSLDPKSKEEITALLESLNQTLGVTVLMVSHDTTHIDEQSWAMSEMVGGCFNG